MRILALAKYGERAASTRQRLLQFSPFLQRNGIDLDVRPLLDNDYLDALMNGRPRSRGDIVRAYGRRVGALPEARGYDAVWIQYELFPYLPFLDGLLAAASPKPIIYDIDDAIFHMYDAHRSSAVRRLIGGKLRPLMRRAAICLCGNTYLRDYVLAAGGRALVVPTVVDTDSLRPAPKSESPLTVGWIGSPSTWRYVEPLLPILLPVLVRLGARFRVVGAGPAARGIAHIDALDWSEQREAADLQSMDIGLMPVPDEPWARGKCGYKLIQYMACGLPVIASPVGVNGIIVENGVEGYLARTPDDWVDALQALAQDRDLRRNMGEAGRRKVVDAYSRHSQEPVILAAFRDAMTQA